MTSGLAAQIVFALVCLLVCPVKSSLSPEDEETTRVNADAIRACRLLASTVKFHEFAQQRVASVVFDSSSIAAVPTIDNHYQPRISVSLRPPGSSSLVSLSLRNLASIFRGMYYFLRNSANIAKGETTTIPQGSRQIHLKMAVTGEMDVSEILNVNIRVPPLISSGWR